MGFWSLHGIYQWVESKRRLPTNIGRFNESFDLETVLATQYVFFCPLLRSIKKFNGPRINGWECPLLRSFGVVLEPPKGRTTRGRNWNTLKYEFFKGLCPIVVLSLGASGTSLNLLRTGRIVLSLGACLRSASLQEPRLKHFTEACG